MKSLVSTLAEINWVKNISSFGESIENKKVEDSLLKIAIWANAISDAEDSNPALCFSNEMLASAQTAAMSIALGIYKSSAVAMRSAFESALYYSYFRTHPNELATLAAKNNDWYLTKQEIIAYHQTHTLDFLKLSSEAGITGMHPAWYASMSAIVHSQIPGIWSNQNGITNISFNENLTREASAQFELCAEIINKFLLCTVARDLWSEVSHDLRKTLLKGLSKEFKIKLGLTLI
jgi:hypothetical protein